MTDLVKEKKIFEILLQSRRYVDKEAYNSKNRDVKKMGEKAEESW